MTLLNADRILAASLAAQRIGQRWNGARVVTEVAIVFFSAICLITNVGNANWTPVVMVFVSCVPVSLAMLASRKRVEARHARHVSMMAFVSHRDVDKAQANAICSRLSAKGTTEKRVEDYWSAAGATPTGRLREACAESAFFTRKLLRAMAWILVFCGTGMVTAGFLAVCWLLFAQLGTSNVRLALKLICGGLLVGFGLKSLWAAHCAFSGANFAKWILEELSYPGRAEHHYENVSAAYDMERARGVMPSNTLYRVMRDRLDLAWTIYRDRITWE